MFKRVSAAASLFIVTITLAALAADPPRIDPADYPADRKIRVACVGDSITFGHGVEDRNHKSYPAVLASLLGDRFDVRNFGNSGSTLLTAGDKPWRDQSEFKAATGFDPDVVVIMLGTNDTKPHNWRHKDRFVADYKALIEHFRALPAKPKLWVVQPVPAIKDNFGINEKSILEQRPMLAEVAEATGSGLLDLHGVDKAEWFLGDGIHPNAAGAKEMAHRIHAGLLQPATSE